jgi:hypothetical protein
MLLALTAGGEADNGSTEGPASTEVVAVLANMHDKNDAAYEAVMAAYKWVLSAPELAQHRAASFELDSLDDLQQYALRRQQLLVEAAEAIPIDKSATIKDAFRCFWKYVSARRAAIEAAERRSLRFTAVEASGRAKTFGGGSTPVGGQGGQGWQHVSWLHVAAVVVLLPVALVRAFVGLLMPTQSFAAATLVNTKDGKVVPEGTEGSALQPAYKLGGGSSICGM